MHPPRAGTIHRIDDRFSIKENEDTIEFAIGVDMVKLDEIQSNIVRNILTEWKNAKTNRARRRVSKTLGT